MMRNREERDRNEEDDRNRERYRIERRECRGERNNEDVEERETLRNDEGTVVARYGEFLSLSNLDFIFVYVWV
ncbi:hypothetical protein Bca4012_082945 [Brassica carinata]